jgi:uncharacterized protein YciI
VSEHFLVRQTRGPAWDLSRARREQAGWEEHAAFVDRLVATGRIVLAGPLDDLDGEDVALVVLADDEADARALLEADPWRDGVLRTAGVERWNVWVGAERLPALTPGPRVPSARSAGAPGSPAVARAALALLCLYCLALGGIAAFAPRAFYDDFPFFAHWVELLPPYNEHLVTDVGGLYLGFALLFGRAAWGLERTLVLATCAAFVLSAGLHLIFHASHLEGFGTVDGIAEIAALAALLLPPVVAIWGVGKSEPAPRH